MNKKANDTPKQRQKNYRPGCGSLLDVSELAAAVGENVRTINAWRRKQMIPVVDLGFRCKRYHLDAVLRALKKRTIPEK
jgi:hypothetical protein